VGEWVRNPDLRPHHPDHSCSGSHIWKSETMKDHMPLLIILGIIAVVGIISGTVLATADYSSAGAFSVASACVGVLGTLIVMDRNGG
jgi:hypothetical protein